MMYLIRYFPVHDLCNFTKTKVTTPNSKIAFLHQNCLQHEWFLLFKMNDILNTAYVICKCIFSLIFNYKRWFSRLFHLLSLVYTKLVCQVDYQQILHF